MNTELSTEKPVRAGYLLGATVFALVLARAYYEVLIRHGARIRVWALQEAWPIAAMSLVAALCATLFVRQARHRISTPLVLLIGAATGMFALATVSPIGGLVLGIAVAAVNLSDRLQAETRRLARYCLFRFVPLVIAGTLSGALLTYGYFSPRSGQGEATKWLCYGTGGVAALVAIALGTRSVRRQQHVNWVQAALLLIVAGVGLALSLWTGREVEMYRRVSAIRRVNGEVYHDEYAGRDRVTLGLYEPTIVNIGAGGTERHLHSVAAFTELHSLALDQLKINDADLAILRSLSRLREFSIANSAVGENGLKHLLSNKNLAGISISNTNCTSRVLSVLSTLPRLLSLSIDTLQGPCDKSDLQQLATCKTLFWLELNNSGVADEHLALLATYPTHHLSITNNAITGATLGDLAKSATITSLDLSGNTLDPSSLAALAPLKLVWLRVADSKEAQAFARQASLDDLVPLLSMKPLASLQLPDVHVSDSMLRLLFQRGFNDLEVGGDRLTGRFPVESGDTVFSIHVGDKTLTAADIARLARLDQSVVLRQCRFTPGAIAEFANQPIRIFTLHDCKVEPRFEQAIAPYVIIPK